MADVTDMRGYIEILKQMGELRELEGVDLNLEVGALTERAAEKEGPALLFWGCCVFNCTTAENSGIPLKSKRTFATSLNPSH